MGGFLLPRADRRRRVEAMLALFPQLQAMPDRPALRLSGGERNARWWRWPGSCSHGS
ncbi:MAG TPA: hypothetical protein VMW47_07270 [Verrucomicrobiae bacterium]|nr:hypothetical protein [Verrucomicrobiae bacterium]